MTPHQALRNLESILGSTDAPHSKMVQAERCFALLWEKVLGVWPNDESEGN